MKDTHLLKNQARDLEEAFFAKENERLLREFREKAELDEKRKALHSVVKVRDPAVIEHLLELGVGPETVIAVMLVPLAAVAWADGSLDEKERKAVLNAASERGIKPGTASYTLLETWLKQKPSQKLMDVWKRYTRSIWEQITKEERVLMRINILGRAREVAEAAGGILGVGSISPQEKAVLEELEKVLS